MHVHGPVAEREAEPSGSPAMGYDYCTACSAMSGRRVSVRVWHEHMAAIEGQHPSIQSVVYLDMASHGRRRRRGVQAMAWQPGLVSTSVCTWNRAALFFPASSNFGSRFPLLSYPVGQNPTVEHS